MIMNLPSFISRARLLTVLAASLAAGCSVQTDVSTTGETAPPVQHLYLTVQSIELNSSATAAPTDSGWVSANLATPEVVDLAQLNGGSLASLVSGLSLPAGSYAQLLLVVADSSAPLTTAAQSAGLTTNAIVEYTDASGALQTRNVEFAGTDGLLLMPIALSLTSSSASTFFAGSSSTSGASGGSTAAGSTSGGANSTVAIDIGALRGFVPMAGNGDPSALVSPTLAAYDTSVAGAISGSVDLSALAPGVTAGYQGVVATAEMLSSDGSRYVAVKSVPIASDGTYELFPLAAATDGSTRYDLVLHGPGVQAVIVAAVPVTGGASQASTLPLVTLAPASDYAVNTPSSGVAATGGTQVDFYQSVPGDAAPHLIEYALLNPFTQTLPVDIRLSQAAILHGSYDATTVSLAADVPSEGAGVYRVATEGALRAPSGLGTLISAPASAAATATLTPPALAIAAGASAGSLSGTVSVGTPSRYDSVFLLLSHGGQLIDVLNLSSGLSSAGGIINFTDSNVPAATSASIYDVTVRAWSSADPAGTLVRATGSSADLRTSETATTSLQLP
jgi:hypothetical protein